MADNRLSNPRHLVTHREAVDREIASLMARETMDRATASSVMIGRPYGAGDMPQTLKANE